MSAYFRWTKEVLAARYGTPAPNLAGCCNGRPIVHRTGTKFADRQGSLRLLPCFYCVADNASEKLCDSA
jgi:hypothetical protein